MKLRLKGDSIRIRLDRRDIERLVADGLVEDAVDFGLGRTFSYAVEAASAPADRPQASFEGDRITVRIDPIDAAGWLASDRVSFDHLQPVDGGSIRVLLEKDFACIDRPAGEESDDAYAFPDPSLAC